MKPEEINVAKEPQPVCDVCGVAEAEHRTGCDHAFVGTYFEWPSEAQEKEIDDALFQSERHDVINAMVNAFLSWPLPKSVRPDQCVMDTNYPHRIGTNLLTAIEAKQMFEHVLSRTFCPSCGGSEPNPAECKNDWHTTKG